MDYPFPSMASAFAAKRLLSAAFAVALLSAGCSSSDSAPPQTVEGVNPAPEGEPWKTLDEWQLFTDAAEQEPEERVIPYDVNSPLYADYASKYRFLYVPDGKKIGYADTAVWELPVGSILVKTFSYFADVRDPSSDERLLETRLLIHQTDGWKPHTYLWNESQTEATLKTGGTDLDVTFIDESGTERTNSYSVPSENDCRSCHGKLGQTDTLGGRTRQLDRDHDYGDGPVNQIDHLAELGLLDDAPAPGEDRQRLEDPFGDAPVWDRARSYLDSNCAHCHQTGNAQAAQSGLFLDYDSTDPALGDPAGIGVCKQPASAGGATCGYSFDIVPGKPDESIYICRMESTNPKYKMPTVGRNLVHTEGVALMRDWIASMPGDCGGN